MELVWFGAIVIIGSTILYIRTLLIQQKKSEDIILKGGAYKRALAALSDDPTNHKLHEHALRLGREYSAATRDGKGVTLFDEAALANDIRAVTANATKTTPAPNVSTTTPQPYQTTLEDRIAALKKMKESGLLSDEEFEQKRKSILDSI